MSAALNVPRRALTGFLGFVAVGAASDGSGGPDAALERALATLQQVEQEFAALPEDHPDCRVLIARVDELLTSAAVVRPVSDRGYAVKARIARVYADVPAGEQVQLWLLSDLMIRGRA